MRNLLIFFTALWIFLVTNGYSQLKPAQSQYYQDQTALVNPGFEQGYKGWEITGCTKSLIKNIPLLSSTLRLTCVGETFSVKQTSTLLVPFAKQQAAFDLQVKSDTNGVKVASINNSIRNTEYSVIGDDEFKRFKQIGVIADAVNNGLEIYSDVAFTGVVDIDNAYLGLSNLTQEVSGAHFVGSLVYFVSGCTWNASTLNTWLPFPLDNDCVASDIKGDIAEANTKINGIKITNARTDGEYRVSRTGAGAVGGGTSSCRYSLSSSSSFENQAISLSTPVSEYDNSLEGNFRFDTGGDKQVQVLAYVTGGGQCVMYGDTAANANTKWAVHFFPDSSNTIVTQDTTLTAETANSLSAKIFNNTTASIISQDYDFIQSVTRTSQGVVNVVFKTGTFTEVPNINCTMDESTMRCGYTSATINAVNIYAVNSVNNGTLDLLDYNFDLQVTKQGADVNKSQTIVGNFEQIRDDALTIVKAEGSSSQVLAANSNIFFNETHDPDNQWNASVFTAKKTGRYVWSGIVATTVSNNSSVYLFRSGKPNKFAYVVPSGFSAFKNFYVEFDMNAGDSAYLRNDTAITLTTSVSTHHMSIRELPDKESIVANIMQGQTTSCQTKYLSADTTGTGIIADLNYSDLIVGRSYIYYVHHSHLSNAILNVKENGNSIGPLYSQASGSHFIGSSFIFTATGNTAYLEKINTVVTYGNGDKLQTYTTLCLQPETTILQ